MKHFNPRFLYIKFQILSEDSKNLNDSDSAGFLSTPENLSLGTNDLNVSQLKTHQNRLKLIESQITSSLVALGGALASSYPLDVLAYDGSKKLILIRVLYSQGTLVRQALTLSKSFKIDNVKGSCSCHIVQASPFLSTMASFPARGYAI